MIVGLYIGGGTGDGLEGAAAGGCEQETPTDEGRDNKATLNSYVVIAPPGISGGSRPLPARCAPSTSHSMYVTV